MCGFCGAYDTTNNYLIQRLEIESMLKKLFHRGPDAQQIYLDGVLGLGFSRLSIIDLEHGMQPSFNEDKSIVMVCNGEIFNYVPLREMLKAKGHVFRCNTDVEVIVHLYEEYGMEFLNKLNGQFAIAIFDKRRGTLICARDQVGIVPLYYTMVDGMFLFASEIKALIEHPLVHRSVDIITLDQIFCFPGSINPRTMFQDIKSLENGTYIEVSINKDIKITTYWDLCYTKEEYETGKKSDEEYIEEFDDLLTQSIKLRLQSDVPVGFFVSGGLDSSIIAAKVMKESGGRANHSFSIDFTEERYSEGKYQRLLVDQIGSTHKEIPFSIEDIEVRLKRAVYHSESVIKESYNTATLALSECVHASNIKVILTGEGADEIFGGYVGYRFDKLRNDSNDYNDFSNPEENRIRDCLWGDTGFFYEKDYKAFHDKNLNIYSSKVREKLREENALSSPAIRPERIKNIDVFHKRSYVDFKLRLTEHLLIDHEDKMLYANSVEGRYPFLDINIINFAKHLPTRMKLNNYTEKYILKMVGKKYISKKIVNRPKFAFVAPDSSEILRRRNEFILDILSEETIKRQGFFDVDFIEQLKIRYMQPNFKLNVPYENDFLIFALTFGILMDVYKLPNFN